MGLGILATLFGGFFTWVFVRSLSRKLLPALRANRRGAAAEGRIVRIRTTKNRFGTTHIPVVRFTTPDGQKVEFLDAVPSQQGLHQTGELVTVRYDPGAPEDSATLAGGLGVVRSIVIASGVTVMFTFVTVFGVLLMIGVVKNQ
jgi:Protein of unknown function (DUF3592)